MSHPLAKRSYSSLPTPPRSPTGIKPVDPVGDVEALKSGSPNLGGGGGGFSPMTPSDGLNTTNYFPAITPVHSNDPLLLATRLQTEEHISELRKRKNGNKTGAFYSKQNAHIASLLKSMDQHILEAEEEEDSNRLAVSRFLGANARFFFGLTRSHMYSSKSPSTAVSSATGASRWELSREFDILKLVSRSILAVLQIYAAVSSLSLSFFATAADAIFDPAANLVLNYCHRKAQKVDLVKFPSGGSKFETIGDITYSGVMGAVSVILVAFSIQELARGDQHDKELHIPAAVVVRISFRASLRIVRETFGD